MKKEMLDLVALIEATRSINVKNALDDGMNRFELPHNKLVSVTTDGEKPRFRWSF